MSGMAEIRYFPQRQSGQVETKFDVENGVMWGVMNPKPRPTFNRQLLSELRSYIALLEDDTGYAHYDGRCYQIEYAVICSGVPGIFNLGGDLSLFRDVIQRGDRDGLISYGRQCIDNLYPWSMNCHSPLTTISLVQGDALGGGFECALASSVLIAEESSRMGFPEILFNLFPGMGAYSFLLRKVGRRITEELITSGNTYTARQLFDMGVVDVLAGDGDGESAVYNYVRKHRKAGNGRRAIESVRNHVQPVDREELINVVSIWADAALRLSERDLRMMERLVRAQNRTTESDDEQDQSSDAAGAAVPLQRMV